MSAKSKDFTEVVDLEGMYARLGKVFFYKDQVEEAFAAEIPESVMKQAADMFRGMTLSEAVEFYSMRTYRFGGLHQMAAVRQIARFFPKKLD